MHFNKKKWNEDFPYYKYKEYLEEKMMIDYKDVSILSHLFLGIVYLGNQILRMVIAPFYIFMGGV